MTQLSVPNMSPSFASSHAESIPTSGRSGWNKCATSGLLSRAGMPSFTCRNQDSLPPKAYTSDCGTHESKTIARTCCSRHAGSSV
eukprot:213513-Prymnesium_polylepis.3